MAANRTRRKLLLSAASTAVALALAALVLWFVRRAEGGGRTVTELTRQAQGAYDMFTPVPDPDVDMMFRPGLVADRVWATGVPLRINQAGLRWDRELTPKRPGVFRVVLLGDSFVAGTASRVENAPPALLQDLLEQCCPTPCEVVPAAVGGWNIRSAVGWLEHNLHVVQPDCVVHVVGVNDFDSGYGFTLGHVRTAWYDGQTGGVHMSTASPRMFDVRCKTPGLIGSYLIPASRARYRDAVARMRRLDELLQAMGAPYFALVLSPWGIGYGLTKEAPFLVDRCWLGPHAASRHTHAPLDGHPDRRGNAGIARTIADILDQRAVLDLDQTALDAWGHDEPLRTLAGIAPTLERTRRRFHVADLPSVAQFTDASLVAAPAVVGGVHTGGVLGREAIVALHRRPEHRRLVVTWRTPDHPALRGGEISVFVDGRRAGVLRMDDSRGRDVVTTFGIEGVRADPLELRLVADRFYTDPVHERREGLFGPMPRVGTLESVALQAGD